MSIPFNFELAPCPFCGRDQKATIPGLGDTPAIGLHSFPGCFLVECEGCGARGPAVERDIGHNEAIAAWNKPHEELRRLKLIIENAHDRLLRGATDDEIFKILNSRIEPTRLASSGGRNAAAPSFPATGI